MKYKLIVTDMDGTLLGSNHKVTDDNKIALSKAVEKGLNVVVATGRMFESAKEHISFIGDKMPIISCNGALIKESDTGNVLYSNCISSNLCIKIVDILNKYNVFYRFCSSDKLFCKYDKDNAEYNKQLFEMMSDEMDIVMKDDFTEDIMNNEILKFIVMSDEDNNDLDKIKKELLSIAPLEITSSWSNNIEIMNSGVNKGNAVSKIANYLGIDKNDIIAFGDNYNDLSMLEYVGMGVAMGNADEYIKGKANYITEVNDNSGVAKALINLIGI